MILRSMIFIFCLTLLSSVQAKNQDKVSDEFSKMARSIRVNRQVMDNIEEQQRIIENAIRHGNFTKDEEKKLKSQLARIQHNMEKYSEKKKMSRQEAQAIYRDLHKTYQMIWLYKHNAKGKNQKIIFFGRELVLRDKYKEMAESGRMDTKTMSRILSSLYQAHRINEQMRETNLTPARKARIQQECFTILSEYFTLAEQE